MDITILARAGKIADALSAGRFVRARRKKAKPKSSGPKKARTKKAHPKKR